MTRLHAKAWLFHRATGLLDGIRRLVEPLEVGAARRPRVERSALGGRAGPPARHLPGDVRRVLGGPGVRALRPDRRRDSATGSTKRWRAERGGPTDLPDRDHDARRPTVGLPAGDPRRARAAEREVHGRWRNLVVMATGTGKTVVAGLDYRRLRDAGAVDSLAVRRPPRGDPGPEPVDVPPHHAATARSASASSAASGRASGGTSSPPCSRWLGSTSTRARPGAFRHGDRRRVPPRERRDQDVRAACSSTSRPRCSLGLTATPERADGAGRPRAGSTAGSPSSCGCGRPSSSGLLARSSTSASTTAPTCRSVRWKRGRGYDVAELTNVYTGHDTRVRDHPPGAARQGRRPAAHAGARLLREHRPRRVHGPSASTKPASQRARSPRRPRAKSDAAASRRCGTATVKVALHRRPVQRGRRRPEIDTVLFLRPTESATVFLQQLGPRPATRRRQAVPDGPRLHRQPAAGVPLRPSLPSADRQLSRRGLQRDDRARLPHAAGRLPHRTRPRRRASIVLKNVRSSLRIDWTGLVSELRRIGDCHARHVPRRDRTRARRHLPRAGAAGGPASAGWPASTTGRPGPDDDAAGRRHRPNAPHRRPRTTRIPRRAARPAEAPTVAASPDRARRLLAMLHFSLWGWNEPLDQHRRRPRAALGEPARREEISSSSECSATASVGSPGR